MSSAMPYAAIAPSSFFPKSCLLARHQRCDDATDASYTCVRACQAGQPTEVAIMGASKEIKSCWRRTGKDGGGAPFLGWQP